MDPALTIFAIDDDPLDLTNLRRLHMRIPDWLMDFHGYSNSNEALLDFPQFVPDVIFLDYHLAGEMGIDVLQRLRSADAMRPIITLTGGGDERIAAEMMRYGASDYLVKGDLTPDVLRSAIAGALTNYKLQQEMVVLQEELAQARGLESLATLTAGISEDFNNIYTILRGHLKMALLQLTGHEAAQSVEGALTACNRMEELIRKLRRSGQRGPKQFTRLDLREQFSKLSLVWKHLLPKEVELDIMLLDSDTLQIMGTESGFDQIMTNLVINAAEAMSHQGRVSVLAGRISRHPELGKGRPLIAAQDDVYVEVRDTGVGIAAEVKNRIFEPYVTTKPRTAANTNRGLGLAVVWNTVNAFGGVVRVDSGEGSGTTAKIYIPGSDTPAN
jgi:signal transduction histidine kinase